MTSTMKFATAAMIALGAAGATNVPRALAIDAKNYPGSMCVKWAGAGIPVYSRSSIGNGSSTSPLYLDCPAVKDSINNSVSSSWVRVKDLHATENVGCSFNSVYMSWEGGMVGWYGPFKYNVAAASNIDTGGAKANSLAHYYFSCRIPPSSGKGGISSIATYRVNENN